MISVSRHTAVDEAQVGQEDVTNRHATAHHSLALDVLRDDLQSVLRVKHSSNA